jgi:8-oxo-dGTP diphosphatase
LPDSSFLSIVCVDVVALTYDRAARRVLVGTHRRTAAPYRGKQALPGVVVHSGERLRDAAGRALEKLGIGSAGTGLGQLRTFDEPSRDPRGPSLSIAMWVALPDSTVLPKDPALWEPIDAVPPLVFDHNEIVDDARAILAERLWRDTDFTRNLTGPEFTATDAVAITEQLSGAPPHRANLNRELAHTADLVEAGTAPGIGGRPPKLWRWE